MKKVALFASGTGSNAQKIYEYSIHSPYFEVDCILSNRSSAKVLSYAEKHGITSSIFSKKELNSGQVLEYLRRREVDVIVLAGFLWLIPEHMISAYADKIINIHPSLLPKYGGKGMYGSHVHSAVKRAGDNRSGMTIHLVNEKYDDGKYIIQASARIQEQDSEDRIAAKVLRLEHHYYPQAVEGLCRYL